MAALSSDLLCEVGSPGTATTLSAPGYTAGDTSITVGSTANWPTATGVVFAIDRAQVVDGVEVQIAGSYNEFEGTVATGTSITNVDWKDGAGDTDYTAGTLTRVYVAVTAERENRIVTWGTQEHNQDGTHSDITATSVSTDTISEKTSANGVAIDGMTIKDGKVVGGSAVGVANSSLDTTVGEIGGRWADWTPTWTNFTLGNATAVFRYAKIGRTVHGWISIVFGSTTAVSGDVIFTLPVAADSNYNNSNTHQLGGVGLADTGTAAYSGYIGIGADDAKGVIRVFNAASTYLATTPLSSTVPHTWTTSDRIEGSFTYEAAS